MRYALIQVTLFACFTFLHAEVCGQLTFQHQFSDSTKIAGFDEIHDVIAVDDGFILSGSVIYPEWEEVMILRINDAGEILWNSNAFQEIRITKVLRFFDLIEDDDFIHAACNYRDAAGGEVDFWKLDKLTGEVIWLRKYEPTDSPYADTILDGDDTSFLWIWNGDDGTSVSRISKITGLELQTTILEGFTTSSTQNAFATDKLGNLYAAYLGELTKYAAPNFQNTLWRYSIDLTINEEYIDRLYSDRMNNLFVFDNSTIHRLNPWTGEALWISSVGITSTNRVDAEIIELENELIFATRHSFVGSGASDFELVRMNKSDGQTIFEVAHSMVGPYGSISGTREGIRSLALDCELNAYVTGYYGDANFGPANWGMMKMDGSTAAKLYEETFTLFPEEEDNLSQGEFIYVKNGVPTMLGEAELIDGQSAHYATIDTLTNAAGAFFELDAGYRYESATTGLSSHEEEVFVLKERGKNLVAEKRSPQGELEWSQEFSAETKLFNGFISAHEEGVLVCYNKSVGELDTIPWYRMETDSITYALLNQADGSIIQDTTILSTYGSGEPAIPLQAILDNNRCFIFEKSQFANKLVRWDFENQTLESVSIFDTYLNGKHELQPMIDLTPSTLMFLGQVRVFFYDKNTLAYSWSLAWSPRPVRDVVQWGDTVYVAANFSTNNQGLTAYRISTNTKLWELSYGNPGSWVQLETGANNQIYALGLTDGAFRVSSLNRQNGTVIQDFYPQSTLWESLIPGTARFLPPHHFVINASNERSDGSSEPVLIVVDMENMELDYVWVGSSPSERKSEANALLIDSNQQVWSGGSWFNATNPYAGYINIYDFTELLQDADCAGDLNGDDVVNIADLLLILSNFGCTQDCDTDLNGNGIGDTGDIIMWLSQTLGTCP